MKYWFSRRPNYPALIPFLMMLGACVYLAWCLRENDRRDMRSVADRAALHADVERGRADRAALHEQVEQIRARAGVDTGQFLAEHAKTQAMIRALAARLGGQPSGDPGPLPPP